MSRSSTTAFRDPVLHERVGAPAPILILCDHASNHVPAEYAGLGLEPLARASHIGWDPGALPVARALAERLDCELIATAYSRLLIDVNRDTQAPDSIVARSAEAAIDVPGNRAIDAAERDRRVRSLYDPYHRAIDEALQRRADGHSPTSVVSVHSFTPVYAGKRRPWDIGVLFDRDRRLAEPLIALLQGNASLVVGINQPYSPADRVYHTLTRHAEARHLPCVMLEIRNDLIQDAQGQRAWADRLAAAFARILARPVAT